MSKSKYYKNIFLIIIFSMILSIFMGFIISRLVAYENHKNTSLFINNILSKSPHLEKEVFTALKSTFNKSPNTNAELLEKYGYIKNHSQI